MVSSSASAVPAGPARESFPLLGMLMLAAAIFACVTSEFLPTGLLPEMAAGLGVSQGTTGLLVTVYAGTVVATAAALTAVTRRLPRKPLIVLVLLVFAVTNLVIALVPSYPVVVAARVLGGLAHGLFWAIAGAYPGHIVAREQLPRAVSIMAIGSALAFVLGVPAGTALGHLLGWRLGFTVVALTIVALAGFVAWLLPPVPQHEPDARTALASPGPDASVPGVMLICAATAVLMVGHYTFYTYLVPFLTEVAGFAESQVSVLLLVYGVAGAAGLLVVGRIGRRSPRTGILIVLAIVVATVLVLGALPRLHGLVVAGLVVWGAAFSIVPALLQLRLLQTASARFRDVASAWFTTSFNIGIGGGAAVGAGVLGSLGLGALPVVDAAITLACILLILIGTRLLARRELHGASEDDATEDSASAPAPSDRR